jgi:hypothetical protein
MVSLSVVLRKSGPIGHGSLGLLVIFEGCSTGPLLVNNATETGWFQDMLSISNGVCFPKGRIQFWQPGEEEGVPLQGQAVLYFGSRFMLFEAVFRSLGCVLGR